MVHGGDGRLDTRSVVHGGDGRLDRVDTRSKIHGGDGRPKVQYEGQNELRSFWWEYASDCALLASVCASYEASCHTFWTHEEWMYNLLLHTSDDHFLKVASAYKKFCARGAAKGICGVCGVSGLRNGGSKLTLKSLRYLIRRGDEFDDSLYGKFSRQLRDAKDPKTAAIARLRLDTLHTYTHPDGTVYHIFEDGVIDDKYCRVCSTCNTSVCHTEICV